MTGKYIAYNWKEAATELKREQLVDRFLESAAAHEPENRGELLRIADRLQKELKTFLPEIKATHEQKVASKHQLGLIAVQLEKLGYGNYGAKIQGELVFGSDFIIKPQALYPECPVEREYIKTEKGAFTGKKPEQLIV